MASIRMLSMWLYLLLTIPIILYLLMDRRPAVETTDFHLEPAVVRPGQKVEAVWTVKSLRANCRGIVHRRMIDSQRQVFAFSSTYAVLHGDAGTTSTYRTVWTIPMGISPGSAILQRNTERWCNPLQQWIWPMQEQYEAKFTVAE